MKRFIGLLTLVAFAVLFFQACKKDVGSTDSASNAISEEVLNQVKNLGFGTSSVQKVEGGYLVEGDILLTEQHLRSKPTSEFLRVGEEEQYRTSNTVLALPRVISVRVNSTLGSAFTTATDVAIARYNALSLLVKFIRVTSGGNIVLNPAPSGATYLASAGFPFDNGNPYNQVLVNKTALNSWAALTKASVIAHEIGHCIGMRHTDYANRSYSCGGSAVNEGASTVGAKLIPGTSSGPSSGSWMLACIGNGVNRPFTSSDKIALNFLY